MMIIIDAIALTKLYNSATAVQDVWELQVSPDLLCVPGLTPKLQAGYDSQSYPDKTSLLTVLDPTNAPQQSNWICITSKQGKPKIITTPVALLTAFYQYRASFSQ